jgi:hypothetical protein
VTAKQIEEHHEKLRFHLDAIRDLKKEHAAAVKNRQAKAMPMAATGPKAPAVQAAPKQLGSSKSSSSAEQPPVKSRPQVWQTYTGHFWGACFFSFDVAKLRAKPATPKVADLHGALGQTSKHPPTQRTDWMRELSVASWTSLWIAGLQPVDLLARSAHHLRQSCRSLGLNLIFLMGNLLSIACAKEAHVDHGDL